jgi:hypothetical protein
VNKNAPEDISPDGKETHLGDRALVNLLFANSGKKRQEIL